MSIQHLLPASHAGQRIARLLLVAFATGLVLTSTLSVTLANLVVP